jgi:hypothetical protein
MLHSAEDSCAFIEALSTYRENRPLLVDFSTANHVDPASLAVMARVLNSLIEKRSIGVQITLPANDDAKVAFLASGIAKHMPAVHVPDDFVEGRMKMLVGSDLGEDRNALLPIIEWVRKRVLRREPKTRFSPTFVAASELMSNTAWHASGEKSDRQFSTPPMNTQWCVHGYGDRKKQEARYAFFDRGVGIPNSRGARLFRSSLKEVRKSDIEIVQAAMNGEIKSRTGFKERGKGLQYVQDECVETKRLRNLVVVTGHAWLDLEAGTSVRLSRPFKGTAFFWTVDCQNL